MLSHFNGTQLPVDLQQLHQLLQAETQEKERALAKVVMLEEEIRALKLVLATQNPSVAPSEESPVGFNGELILVVDDQPINLDLIEALLDDCNLNIVCVASAEEALGIIKTRMPDAILMDIQMPQMDGYTATVHIRSQYGNTRPIILAMTANNTPEDEQKSLAAGMQGHLSKPIDAGVLIKQLDFWLHKDTTKPIAELPDKKPAQQAQPEELPGINLAEALVRLRGNRTLLEEVLISFAEKAALIIPELQQAINTQNIEGATRILHRLKGTSANLSAIHVAPMASRLEAQCKNGQLPNATEVSELAVHIGQLISTAEGLNNAPQVSQTLQPPVDQAAIKDCLARIDGLLHADLGQAEDAVEVLLQLCQNTQWADAAKQLRALFYQFNLRAVHELILNGFE